MKIKYENLIKEENELKENIEKITENFDVEIEEKNLQLVKYFNYEQQFLIDNKNEMIDRNKLLNLQYLINENFDYNNIAITITNEDRNIYAGKSPFNLFKEKISAKEFWENPKIISPLLNGLFNFLYFICYFCYLCLIEFN